MDGWICVSRFAFFETVSTWQVTLSDPVRCLRERVGNARCSQSVTQSNDLVGGLVAGVGVDDAGCIKRVCCDTGGGTQSAKT